MGQYEVTMVCSPDQTLASNLEDIKEAMGSLSIRDLLTLKKDIVELINKKVYETNNH